MYITCIYMLFIYMYIACNYILYYLYILQDCLFLFRNTMKWIFNIMMPLVV